MACLKLREAFTEATLLTADCLFEFRSDGRLPGNVAHTSVSPTLPLLLSSVRLDGDTAIAGNDQNWQYRAQSRQARRAWRVLRRVGNVHRVIVPESTERLGPS
jgi:hypothetical protein